MGQSSIVGPLTFSIMLYVVLAIGAAVLLHFTGLRAAHATSSATARTSPGSRVSGSRATGSASSCMSGTVAALAGILYAARLGAVRASTATGFELDIITVVLLGGVSIFGGSGSMLGVVLSTFLVLNLRNGMSLAGVNGNTQTGIVGLLLILSVLLPNIVGRCPGPPTSPERGASGARIAPPPATSAPGGDMPANDSGRVVQGTASGADRYHARAFDDHRWATTPRIGEVEEELAHESVPNRHGRPVGRAAWRPYSAVPPWRRARPQLGMGAPVVATPGQAVKMLLLPKFLGILPFDQANQGAQEAATELQNPTAFDFNGPAAGDPPANQIDFVTNAPTKGYKVVMMSNNAGEQTSAAAVAAQAAGTKVVTWDSPIPVGQGREPLRRPGRLHLASVRSWPR